MLFPSSAVALLRRVDELRRTTEDGRPRPASLSSYLFSRACPAACVGIEWEGDGEKMTDHSDLTFITNERGQVNWLKAGDDEQFETYGIIG